MKRPTRRKAPHVPVAIVAALLALVGLLVASRWDWLIPVFEARARDAIGRKVTIGHLQLHVGRRVGVVAEDVAIGNPYGWPGGGATATIAHLTFDVGLSDLFWPRSIAPSHVEIGRAAVFLQELADGSSNWASLDSKVLPVLQRAGELSISGGTVRYRSAPTRTELTADVALDEVGLHAEHLRVKGQGTVARQPVDISMEAGSLTASDSLEPSYSFVLQARSGENVVGAKGIVRQPLTDPEVLGQITLQAPGLLGGEVGGEIAASRRGARVERFSGHVAGGDVEGGVRLDMDRSPALITASLRSAQVSLRDIGKLYRGMLEASAPGRRDRAWDWLAAGWGPGEIGLHLTYSAEQVAAGPVRLEDFRSTVDYGGDTLTVDPVTARVGQGSGVGHFSVSQRVGDAMFRGELAFSGVDLKSVLPEENASERGAGRLGGRIGWSGAGASLQDAMLTAGGSARLYFAGESELRGVFGAFLPAALRDEVINDLDLPQQARSRCFVAEADIGNGIFRSVRGMLDANGERIGVSGAVDVGRQSLNLLVRPVANGTNVDAPLALSISGAVGSPMLAVRNLPPVAEPPFDIESLKRLLPDIEAQTGIAGACLSLVAEQAHAPPRPSSRRVPHSTGKKARQ